MSAPAARRPEGAAMAAALLAVAMWGAVPVGTRYLVDGAAPHIAPLPFVALRFAVAALVLAPALWRARPWRWPAPDRRLALRAAALGVIGYNLPVAIGQVDTGAGATALVIATEPIWILLFWALKTRRRPAPAHLAGALAGAAGVALLASPALQGGGPGPGLAWVLAGALCWSAYCVEVVPLVQRHSALAVTATTLALGCGPLLVMAAPDLLRMAPLSGSDLTLILGLALGSTVLATLAWNLAVARLPGPVSGQFLYAIPAVGLTAGHLLLGEALAARSGPRWPASPWGFGSAGGTRPRPRPDAPPPIPARRGGRRAGRSGTMPRKAGPPAGR
ncbi:EamA family transporter [Pseudooceanicola sp. GBMRC 2024]|uniref:EamA family transporter n=1 Tax=Pseudooceanicola albus TaxID=2692189 RepID=A0A6L7G3A0_9RHOB|nr:DMT family transporter [Pseudooceanicola albus]MXN17906.1 EamA family transporter [Pseudooceanicola albus]